MSQREREHAARIRAEFTRQAEPFAALAIHTHEDSLALLREGLGLTGAQSVLDAGCGPGLLALYLAGHAREVVGVDATPAMLDKARALSRERGVLNVRFAEGDMEALPFPAGCFDAVVTRYTFHHLLAPEKALAELVRVCRPGGRVVVCDATPRAAARKAYDDWERVRDVSHTSALTEDELRALCAPRLTGLDVKRFRLVSSVKSLLESSFPDDAQALEARIAADIGVDELDFAAHQRNGALMLAFPISVFSGTAPA